MWPMLLDYTKDECKRILRRLELEAYASIISVFRAQGDLSKDKKQLLQELQQTLSISTERHRAEVRRAINDEKLATIADNIAGCMSTAEWMVEGRRLVPLMPRLVPQTAFTATANQAASAMMEKNASLPPPSQTWNKDGPTAVLPKPTRSSSPSSNVVVLPSGTSIHIKGMLNQEEDEELGVPARRGSNRSLSTDSQNAASVSTQTPRLTFTTTPSTVPGTSPVKITISKSPQGRPISVQSSSQPPKVILVTSAGAASGTTVIQRSVSVPVVKTPPTSLTTLSGGPGPARPTVLGTGIASTAPPTPHAVSNYSAVVTTTSSASLVSTTVTMPTSVIGSSSAMFSPSVQIGLGKVRPRIVPRQRYPTMIPQQKPGVVIPMGPQLMSPAHSVSTASGQVGQPSGHASAGIQMNPAQQSGSSSIQVKTLSKPTIQIKQEGGMKIITQSGTSKILPKPQISGSSGGTPVVMVNTGQSTAGSSVMPRSISTYTAHSGGKVLNITTPGGRVIATTTKATNVVTVNPKTLHLTAVKSGSGSTTVSKPNVIVVQKTQHPRFQNPMGHSTPNIRTLTTSNLPGAIDKELMGLVHKDSQGRQILTASPQTIGTSSTGRAGERRVIITTSGGSGEVKQPVSIIHRGRADSEGKSSLLAELIQAAGIMPSDAAVETTAQGTDPYEFDHQESLPQPPSVSVATVAAATATAAPVPPSRQIVQPRIVQHLPQQQALPPAVQPERVGDSVDGEVEQNVVSFSVTAEEHRVNQDRDTQAEKVLMLEQTMSLLNKEYVDIAEEPEAIHVSVSSSSSVSSSTLLPTVVSATPVAAAPVAPSLGQPKVSILSAAPKANPEPVKGPTRLPASDGDTVKPDVVPDVPEEGLKEGQLDTQTGLFYQVGQPREGAVKTQVSSLSLHAAVTVSAPHLQPTAVLPMPPVTTAMVVAGTSQPPLVLASLSNVSSSSQPPLDLLSSSLAEAQIDLDPFSEDNSNSSTSVIESQGQLSGSSAGHIGGETAVNSRPGMAEVLREETAKDGTRILTVSNPASSQQEVAVAPHGSSQLVSLPSQLTRSTSLPSTHSSTSPSPSQSTASSMFIPVQDVARPAVKTNASVSIIPHVPQQQQQPLPSLKPIPQPSVMPIAVSVEPSPSVITFKLDDLTGQRISGGEQDNEELETSMSIRVADVESLDSLASLTDSVTSGHTEEFAGSGGAAAASVDSHSSDSQMSSDPASLVRSSKRKRKNPLGLDDPGPATPGSWIRTASSLLMKISRFKGSPRDRTEIPAAEWFTFPVDPQDAPDYYTVIQTPMDFSTMRKKLENGQYSSFEEFQADMELIRTNCYLYNSEGTKVRCDCDEVMTFYRSELAKLQEKQANKTFMPNSSPLKRPRVEEKSSQKL
ncbi:BRCA2-interacting transcriptional repressor EMSY isoform X2 [Aplysia californica]|uniref:BRCA2-interacting transcriptional repressor EMSY isoform X2 n=1 Tax=Aplysia californica TaxID=6500 RepID=A0ABM1W0Y4_APLCA|nr:BRCA2-interacting transcriptional repressor EMSY isoform X2 [Aplysia californica]